MVPGTGLGGGGGPGHGCPVAMRRLRTAAVLRPAGADAAASAPDGEPGGPHVQTDLEEEYKAMAAQMPHAAVRLFASGGHPAILSRAEAAKEEILAFWLRCEAAERL